MTHTKVDKALNTRLGFSVERCHGIPHHGSYSNGHHTANAMALLYMLWPEEDLLPFLLHHDVPEAWVGDIPAPMLRHNPQVRSIAEEHEQRLLDWLSLEKMSELEDEDIAKLKAADRLEFVMWCMEQLNFGNRYVFESLVEMDELLTKADPPPSPADAFYNQLKSRFEAGTLLPQQAGIMKSLTQDPDRKDD